MFAKIVGNCLYLHEEGITDEMAKALELYLVTVKDEPSKQVK